MARRRGFRAPRQSRKFVWARYHVDQIVAAEDTSFIDLLQEFAVDYGANLLGATVMRLRGELLFDPSAATNTVNAAGVAIMSREVAGDITAGAQSGGPLSDKHADWMAYKPIIFNSGDPTLQDVYWDIDVKSARKMEEVGQSCFLVVENDIVGTTITVRGVVSVGFKLP